MVAKVTDDKGVQHYASKYNSGTCYKCERLRHITKLKRAFGNTNECRDIAECRNAQANEDDATGYKRQRTPSYRHNSWRWDK